MSHELRSPINASVIGSAELLTDTTSLEQKELVYTLRISGEATLSLINDILDLSKIEAGQMTLEKTEVDIRELIEQVIGVLADKAQSKGIAIHGLVDPRIIHPVASDPTRLRQVLTNLISNAVKFTEHGSVVIEASVEASNPRHDRSFCGS